MFLQVDYDNLSNTEDLLNIPYAQASQNNSVNVTNQSSTLFEYPEEPLALAEYVPVSQNDCTLGHANSNPSRRTYTVRLFHWQPYPFS